MKKFQIRLTNGELHTIVADEVRFIGQKLYKIEKLKQTFLYDANRVQRVIVKN